MDEAWAYHDAPWMDGPSKDPVPSGPPSRGALHEVGLSRNQQMLVAEFSLGIECKVSGSRVLRSERTAGSFHFTGVASVLSQYIAELY
jgi:hypothetical protein